MVCVYAAVTVFDYRLLSETFDSVSFCNLISTWEKTLPSEAVLEIQTFAEP